MILSFVHRPAGRNAGSVSVRGSLEVEMQPAKANPIWGILGLCLLVVLLPRAMPPRPAAVAAVALPAAGQSLPPRGPFERALWTALHCRTRARLAVNQQLEAFDESDPTAADPMVGGITGEEALRLKCMAADRNGDLGLARAHARRAQRLARTAAGAIAAAELLALIEHESGNHEEELRQAQKLIALRPRQLSSLVMLWRAAGCTRRPQLQQWAARRLSAIERSRQ